MKDDTVWLTQAQMVELFERERTVITKHINNIFKERKLDQESNVQKMHITNSDKPVTLYSLDVIGHRVYNLTVKDTEKLLMCVSINKINIKISK